MMVSSSSTHPILHHTIGQGRPNHQQPQLRMLTAIQRSATKISGKGCVRQKSLDSWVKRIVPLPGEEPKNGPQRKTSGDATIASTMTSRRPSLPPMPDLSHLTEEERKVIEDVLRRQREEEEKEHEVI
ncbi:regulating synaptic membrane exocytosis protein 2, partial [Biomphalaria glabrata]